MTELSFSNWTKHHAYYWLLVNEGDILTPPLLTVMGRCEFYIFWGFEIGDLTTSWGLEVLW